MKIWARNRAALSTRYCHPPPATPITNEEKTNTLMPVLAIGLQKNQISMRGKIGKFLSSSVWEGGLIRASWYVTYGKGCLGYVG